MKINLASAIKYLFFLAAGLLLLWLAFRNFDSGRIAGSIAKADFTWVGLTLLLAFFAFLSRAYRWNLLIHPLGYRPRLSSSFYALLVGYFANFAIPRIGEITRCAMLGRKEKIPADELLGTVIAERTIDVLTLLLIMIILVTLEFGRIGNFLYATLLEPFLHRLQDNFPVLIITGSVASLAFLALYFYWRKNSGIEGGAFQKKAGAVLRNIFNGLRTVTRLKNPLAFWLHTLIIWIIYYLVSYLCFFATEPTSALGFMAGLYTLVIGGVGMSAPVQGGIGTFHWIISEGLTLYGVSREDGLIYATLVHASQSLLIVVLGGFSYFMLLLSGKKNDKK